MKKEKAKRAGSAGSAHRAGSAARANVRTAAPAKAPSLALSAVPVVAYNQATAPLREWDRGTQFMSAFAVSGFLNECTAQGEIVAVRPASVVLVGNPGSGKTELVERFKGCPWLSYHNDLTVRSLLPLLRKAEHGQLTHIAASEFNKWFQRKAFVAENCVGLLCSAMEEGVSHYSVGPNPIHFNAARLGLFAGMTPRTMNRRRESLADMGFMSRVCALAWELPQEERKEILRRMNLGIATDLDPIRLERPDAEDGREIVVWDARVGDAVKAFAQEHWPENDLRTFKRFKTLMLARAYLTGRKKVSDAEWQWLRTYDDYWQRLIVGED